MQNGVTLDFYEVEIQAKKLKKKKKKGKKRGRKEERKMEEKEKEERFSRSRWEWSPSF